MSYVFAVLAGLIWGLAAAALNARILKKALEKNAGNAVMAANLCRTFVDIAALLAVFLLREYLPFSYTVTIIATAVAMSLATIVFSYRLAGKK